MITPGKLDRRTIAAGLVSALPGLFLVGLAFFGDEASFEAPRWVVAAGGGVFFFGGLIIFGQGRPRFQAVVVALLLTCFGALATWVAWGPGEREFSASLGLPFLEFEGQGSERFGRLCFSPGAIVLDVLAIYQWIRLLLGRIP